MPGKTLKTNASNWSLVFRKLVQYAETDPDIRRVVGADNLRSWSGVPGDKLPMQPSAGKPIVRFTPMPADVGWYSPDSQLGTLAVHVEIAVQSLCVDDVIDLWDTVVTALRPGNGTLAQDLVTAGAETGEIVFSDPSFDPRPDAQPEGYFFASGRFHLRVLRSVNP